MFDFLASPQNNHFRIEIVWQFVLGDGSSIATTILFFTLVSLIYHGVKISLDSRQTKWSV